MEEMTNQINQLSASWNPGTIVSLLKVITWPLVALLLGLTFKGSIADLLKYIFTKNDVEVSAAGVTAKITASQHAREPSDVSITNLSTSSSKSLSETKQLQVKYESVFSKQLLKQIRTNVAALGGTHAELNEVLLVELSLYQAVVQFWQINKVLLRSQLTLFNNNMYPDRTITLREYN